jgi:glycosyltransferase involved in cell wall biosynthesis
MEENKEISVIIPVFNAEICIAQTVSKIHSVLSSMNLVFEIILVDDASTDHSWRCIKEIKANNSSVQAVRFNKNYGQHNALLCGINVSSGKYIVTIDDDLEQDPNDIEILYRMVKSEGFDLVYGMPVNVKKNFFRKVLTKIYKKISQIENKNAGGGSSFRIFTNQLRSSMLNHGGSLFFLDEIALWYTDNIGYATVRFQRSMKSGSGYGISSLFTLSLRVLSLSSTMPLKLVRMLGLYISVISVLLGFYFFVRKFSENVPMGYTSIIVAILFGTGITSFSLGIIGEYLGNLIALSNKKPSYSIREKI